MLLTPLQMKEVDIAYSSCSMQTTFVESLAPLGPFTTMVSPAVCQQLCPQIDINLANENL